MIEPVQPKFSWGQRVRANTDLFNDGSYPDFPAEALLVKVGDLGEVVNVGVHADANIAVYLVEFGEKLVIGCLEEEISPLDIVFSEEAAPQS
jgi:nitrogen fixation protein NifZ